MSFTIRRATDQDKSDWLRLRQGLWPDAPVEYLSFDLDRHLVDPDYAVFVASGTGKDWLRSSKQGCATTAKAARHPPSGI